jgi:hypothetical protein
MDLAGGEGDHGIGSQTEQVRLRGPGGEAATESSRANARDAHRQRRALIGSAEEGQENVIADPETANLLVQLDIIDTVASAQLVDILDLDGDSHGGFFPPAG